MQAWDSFLTSLENEYGVETIKRWLRPLKILQFDAGNLYLEAQDSFQIEWFKQHIQNRAKKEFLNSNFRSIKIHLSLPNKTTPSSHDEQCIKQIETSSVFTLSTDSLDPSFLFAEYVVCEENSLPLQFLQELVDSESSFNPVYLHGSSSSGKTHILQAITTEYRKNGKNALYIRAETFTENVVKAIRSSHMQEFRQAHRHIDVLIFDDVHQLSKKTTTQEELFHTFNSLHVQNKQMIFSASCPPALLQDIEPRLVSRFEWGITLSLNKLPKEKLYAMLQRRCKALHFSLDDSIILFLLETFSYNLKSLHSALEALVLRSHHQGLLSSELNLSKVQDMLKNVIEEEKKQMINPHKILTSVATFYAMPLHEILGKAQTQDCTLPRQISMYLCREELKMPFAKIGQFFGRDHSTVMTSVKNIEEKLRTHDSEISHALLTIRQSLEN